MTRQELLHLLATNELEMLLAALAPLCAGNPSWQRRQVLLAARFHEIVEKEHLTITPPSELAVAYGQLRAALQDLIDDVAPLGGSRPAPPPRRRRWLGPVAVLALGLLGLAGGFRPLGQADFRAELRVSALQITLAEDWPSDFDFAATQVELYGLQQLSAGAGSWPRGNDAGPINDAIFAGKAQLGPFRLQTGQALTLRGEPEILQLEPSAALAGQLTLQAGQLELLPDGPTHTFASTPDDDKALDWELQPGGTLSATHSDSLALPPLAVSAVAFGLRTGSQQRSSVQGGTLTVEGASGPPLALAAGDKFRLTGLSNTRLEVKTAGADLRVILRGRAKGIRSGYPAATDQKPTWWEWLSTDRQWALVGGILAWLLGQAITIFLALRK